MRITMVQVSAGARYDPSLVPNLPKKSDEPKKEQETPKEPANCCGVEPSETPARVNRSVTISGP
jgi:hypothetical protein